MTSEIGRGRGRERRERLGEGGENRAREDNNFYNSHIVCMIRMYICI